MKNLQQLLTFEETINHIEESNKVKLSPREIEYVYTTKNSEKKYA